MSEGLGAVPDEQLLAVLSAQVRLLASQQAQVWQTMNEIASRNPMTTPLSRQQMFDAAVDEIRAELRLTRRAAENELTHAVEVCALPRVSAALQAGRIDRTRAIVLAEGCWDLTPEQQAELLEDVLPDAGARTATALADRVRRVAIALDPGWAERRYRESIKDRRVVTRLNEDGTATMAGENLPADEAAVASARVAALAAAAKRAGATARIDHLRAELFLGLLDGRWQEKTDQQIVSELVTQFRQPDATTFGVEVRVGLGTLMGLDEKPGEIAGLGVVPASVARQMAAKQRRSEWRFAVVDAEGRLLFDGVTRHRPEGMAPGGETPGGIVEIAVPLVLLDDPTLAQRFPAWAKLLADLAGQYAHQAPIEQDPTARFPGRPLRRRSQIRHRTCLFPGCRRPAAEAQQDHRLDHALGGRTDEANLAPGCPHDHDLKTKHGWRLAKRDDTTYVWISPLGRKHLSLVDPVAPPLPEPRPWPDPPPY